MRDANRYVDATQPWVLARDPAKHPELALVLHELAAVIGVIGGLVTPVLPTTGRTLREWVGIPAARASAWPSVEDLLQPIHTNAIAKQATPLYPRLDEAAQTKIFEHMVPPDPASLAQAARPASAAPVVATKTIEFADFEKLELRVGKVLTAVAVPKKDKLLHLSVDLGEARPRSIVAGIAQAFQPEVIVGKQVIVVANLAPRKMAGLVSEGMILAAGDDQILGLSAIDHDVPPGTRVR